jgi:hypothetical protein
LDFVLMPIGQDCCRIPTLPGCRVYTFGGMESFQKLAVEMTQCCPAIATIGVF